jgi:phage terminase Nu1 subunit (DNA packaging protein)
MTKRAKVRPAALRKQRAVEHVRSGVLAQLLGVSQRQVAQLAKQGMPHEGEMYDVAACVQWYVRRRSHAARPANELKARTRKLTADAEISELNLAERRGNLIPMSVHEQRVEALARRLFAALTGQTTPLVMQAFPELPPLEAERKAEAIADGLIAACRATVDEIDEAVDARALELESVRSDPVSAHR